MSKVYVASPWGKRETAKSVAAMLEGLGLGITRKWWLFEDPAAGMNDSKGSIGNYSKAIAVADVEAVKDADMVVALVYPEGGVGMWIESGAALALDKPVYFINGDNFDELPPRRSIFDNMVTRLTLGQLLEEVKHDGP